MHFLHGFSKHWLYHSFLSHVLPILLIRTVNIQLSYFQAEIQFLFEYLFYGWLGVSGSTDSRASRNNILCKLLTIISNTVWIINRYQTILPCTVDVLSVPLHLISTIRVSMLRKCNLPIWNNVRVVHLHVWWWVCVKFIH